MMQLLQWWKVVATLASISTVAGIFNSVNLKFENTVDIDLSVLGTPNLDKYDATVDFSVRNTTTDGCIYEFHINYDPNGRETPAGGNEFEGNCEPNDFQGDATDDLPWHAPRRHWLRFSEEIFNITGLNHLSMEWHPCGRAPGGFRKARWDFNFYTVTPEYRTFMVCNTFKTPSVCQYNQSSHLGRSMFTVPRLARDSYYLVNLPLNFAPDPEYPEAYQYEGLTHYDPELVPNTTANWTLPSFLMSTYDAEAVSWRAMIPHSFYNGKYWIRSEEWQYYVYQTKMGLPSNWSTYYDGSRMDVWVQGSVIENSTDLCGPGFVDVKKKNEIGIVFEGKGGYADGMT